MLVPKLRFKEFTDEWKEIRLRDVVDRITRKNTNNESNLPLTISAQYGLIDQTTFFNRNVSSADLTGYYLLNNGDFAYNKSYSNGYPLGTVKKLDKYDKGVVSTLYICFKNKDNISSDFLAHYFETNKWYKEISLISVEGARNHGLLNIAVQDFFDTSHIIPNNPEQDKIANFLSLLDKKIELQSKKIEVLKLYKYSQLNQILTSNNPQELPLKDVAIIKKGVQINSEQLLKVGDYYMLNGGIAPSGWLNKYNTDKNTVSISEGGNSCGYVNYNYNNFWCGGHCYSLTPKNINNEYLYHLLKYNESKIMKLRIGTGLPNIQKKDLEKYVLSVHVNKTFQNKVASAFMLFDYKINLENKKLKILKNFKKGLMHQLFI